MLHNTEILEQARAVDGPHQGSLTYDVSLDERFDPDTALTLWHEADTASVFNHPAWWRAAFESYGAGRRVITVSVRTGGRLCGYWPFWEKRLGAKDAFARVLEPIGSRHIDYVMPLVGRGHDQSTVIGKMLGALRGEFSPRAMILWSKAGNIQAADGAVKHAFPERHLIHRYIRRCPRMSLPATYDELESRWSKKHRIQVRRQSRRLGDKGELDFFVARSRADIRELLAAHMKMHKTNWGARGGSEFDDPRNVGFVEKLTENLPLDLILFSATRLDGQPVSTFLDFSCDGEIHGYKTAFDPTFAQQSPGKVHMALEARWAIEQGYTIIDFMQGEEGYKFSWADHTRETVSHAIASPLALPVWYWNTKLRDLIIEYKI